MCHAYRWYRYLKMKTRINGALRQLGIFLYKLFFFFAKNSNFDSIKKIKTKQIQKKLSIFF